MTSDVLDAADRPEFSDQGDLSVIADTDLLTEAGVDLFYSTSETAEFFDRTNQWLYWGLRDGVFTDDDGVPLAPERIGPDDDSPGRRRFTISLIRQIMRSSYRRGNLDPEQLKTIMRRIKLTEEGIEWREREGWRYAHLGRNRWRWVRPEEAYFHSSAHEWRRVKTARSARVKDDK